MEKQRAFSGLPSLFSRELSAVVLKGLFYFGGFMSQLGINPKKSPTKYERIVVINRHIKHIEKTSYPPGYENDKRGMIAALEKRIDAIVEGKV